MMTNQSQSKPAGSIKTGLRFLHSRVLDSTYELRQRVPQLFQVTRIAGGNVYYRPVYGTGTDNERLGSVQYASIATFPQYVRTYVDQDYRPPVPEYTDFLTRGLITRNGP